MVRYYFDFVDGGFTRDNEGTDLDTLSAVRSEALATLSEMGGWIITRGKNHPLIVSVRDESGRQIYEASMIIDEKNFDDEVSKMGS